MAKIISLVGRPGSGKTRVSKILARRLEFGLVSINRNGHNDREILASVAKELSRLQPLQEKRGIVLDGLPDSIDQYAEFPSVLAGLGLRDKIFIFVLDVSEAECLDRLEREGSGKPEEARRQMTRYNQDTVPSLALARSLGNVVSFVTEQIARRNPDDVACYVGHLWHDLVTPQSQKKKDEVRYLRSRR